jgi:hypothetical protein
MSVITTKTIETENSDIVEIEEDTKQQCVFISINNNEYACLNPDDIDNIIISLTQAKQNIYKS